MGDDGHHKVADEAHLLAGHEIVLRAIAERGDGHSLGALAVALGEEFLEQALCPCVCDIARLGHCADVGGVQGILEDHAALVEGGEGELELARMRRRCALLVDECLEFGDMVEMLGVVCCQDHFDDCLAALAVGLCVETCENVCVVGVAQDVKGGCGMVVFQHTGVVVAQSELVCGVDEVHVVDTWVFDVVCAACNESCENVERLQTVVSQAALLDHGVHGLEDICAVLCVVVRVEDRVSVLDALPEGKYVLERDLECGADAADLKEAHSHHNESIVARKRTDPEHIELCHVSLVGKHVFLLLVVLLIW
eukprot:comp15017_c0_seq1/m.22288 comp15017_c0_seq1/g.22288  ORF comp15017_c0_seq1/g.22288 comp15017_c0_seq1/m.22288 type:complete len:309 (-) comp15017_c0_seq1:65-991(-)